MKSEFIQYLLTKKCGSIVTHPDGSSEAYLKLTTDDVNSILQYNTINRNLATRRVREFANIFNDGQWDPKISKMHLSQNLRLLDGQHRLEGFVTSNVPESVFQFVLNSNESDIHKIDVGISRSSLQVGQIDLRIHGNHQDVSLFTNAKPTLNVLSYVLTHREFPDGAERLLTWFDALKDELKNTYDIFSKFKLRGDRNLPMKMSVSASMVALQLLYPKVEEDLKKIAHYMMNGFNEDDRYDTYLAIAYRAHLQFKGQAGNQETRKKFYLMDLLMFDRYIQKNNRLSQKYTDDRAKDEMDQLNKTVNDNLKELGLE